MGTAIAVDSGEIRRAAAIAAAGAAPFVVGRLALDPPAVGDADPVVCPFRLATGLPCPLCGSTRGVVLAVRGDGAFAEYNLVAVAALAAVALYGLVALAVALRGGRLRLPAMRRRTVVGLVIGLAAVAWAWTLAHRDTIVS